MARKLNTQGRRTARPWNQPDHRCPTCREPIWKSRDGRPSPTYCSRQCREAAAQVGPKERKRYDP